MNTPARQGWANSAVAFRVDGGGTVGAGHVMRCLTLANALKARDATCHFLSMPGMGPLADAVQAAGHQLHTLTIGTGDQPDDGKRLLYADWIGHSQRADSAASFPILKTLRPAWLVLDHYALDERWQRDMTILGVHHLTIDDLADRAVLSDIHVDPNPLNAQLIEDRGLLPDGSTRLLGCDFALLRPEFREARAEAKVRGDDLHLLIMMGGVDHDNVSSTVLRWLADTPQALDQVRKVSVILGAAAAHRADVERMGAGLPCAFEVLQSPDHLARIMAGADMCIGAAGGTAWERCAVGLPSLTVILAENQKGIAGFLDLSDAAIMVEQFDRSHLLKAFARLCQPQTRQALRDAGQRLVDGRGTERIVDAMEAYQ